MRGCATPWPTSRWRRRKPGECLRGVSLLTPPAIDVGAAAIRACEAAGLVDAAARGLVVGRLCASRIGRHRTRRHFRRSPRAAHPSRRATVASTAGHHCGRVGRPCRTGVRDRDRSRQRIDVVTALSSGGLNAARALARPTDGRDTDRGRADLASRLSRCAVDVRGAGAWPGPWCSRPRSPRWCC